MDGTNFFSQKRESCQHVWPQPQHKRQLFFTMHGINATIHGSLSSSKKQNQSDKGQLTERAVGVARAEADVCGKQNASAESTRESQRSKCHSEIANVSACKSPEGQHQTSRLASKRPRPEIGARA
eukprot:3564848-Rhodomonas_salina.1